MLMKKIFVLVLCTAMLASFAAAGASAETAQAPQTVPVVQYLRMTKDQLLTIALPDENWYQIPSDENTEMFSDGDCAILVNLYKVGDKLPEIQTSDDHHEMVYTAAASTKEYTLHVVGYAHEEKDFSGICKAINTIKIDPTKITAEMLKHDIAVSDYTIVDTNYAAWVSATRLNVRSASGLEAQIIGSLNQNDPVTVTGTVLYRGTDYGWSRIRLANGTTGYVYTPYLTTNKPGSSPTRTGAYELVYDVNGHQVDLYEYTDGLWRTGGSGAPYRRNDANTWVDNWGGLLTRYAPVHPTEPDSPSRTGSYEQVYDVNGHQVDLYEYNDGIWRTGGSGAPYSRVRGDTWMDSWGNTLTSYDPTFIDPVYPDQNDDPQRTGAYEQVYDSNGNQVDLYEYTDYIWRTGGSGAPYNRIGEDMWMNDWGDMLYRNNPLA